MEWLNRGVVAVPSGQGVLVSWRLLGTDPVDIAFNVLRDGQLLNGEPLTSSTNYLDAGGRAGAVYEVRPVVGGASGAATAQAQIYRTIDLQRPAGGTTPDGVAFTYSPSDATAADLDGDGDYELVFKWEPSNAKDNSQSGYTGNVLLEAVELTGESLWRLDLGRNVRAGAHYTQFLAYDFNGNGRAEVALRTSDGSKDATGKVIGNANADHRNSGGYILSGPEFLTVFDGATGAEIVSVDFPAARGRVSDWGDNYGNRVDRFLAGVAYLDGERPSMIFSRGYYEKAVIAAVDYRAGRLIDRWLFTADGSQNQAYRGQGAHSLSIADVDDDGRQEIIFGAATIDDDGRGLYSTGLGHGDALHVTDIDPNRDGLEVFMVHECPSCYGEHGVEVHDARTGEILYSNDGGGTDVGRGVAFDVDPRYAGLEVTGSRGGTMTTTGQRFNFSFGSNFGIWWDGDLLRELLNGTTIDKWDWQNSRANRLLSASSNGAAQINGTKATPMLQADLFGDWREEVVWPNSNNRQLMVYTTNIATDVRLPTLMHDAQYRVAISWQNVGYNQPPHPGFFLGADMPPAPWPDIYFPAPNQ